MFWKLNFSSCSFFRCFYVTCKLYMSGLFIIPYFGNGQCSSWGLLVFALTKSASLLLLVIFHYLEMTQFWCVNYISLVYKLKYLLWTCLRFWAIFMTEFGTVFFSTFWRYVETCILKESFSKSYIYVFFLSKKQHNSS